MSASVAKKIAAVMADMPELKKDGFNKHGGYGYPTAEGIDKALRSVMPKHGLVAVPTSVVVTNRFDTKSQKAFEVFVTLDLIDSDTGEKISAVGYGCGADVGEKGPMKAFTSAVREALKKTFRLSAKGDDPEHDSDDESPRKPVAKSSSKREHDSSDLEEQLSKSAEKAADDKSWRARAIATFALSLIHI